MVAIGELPPLRHRGRGSLARTASINKRCFNRSHASSLPNRCTQRLALSEFRQETVLRFSGSVNYFVEKSRISASAPCPLISTRRSHANYRGSWQFDLLSLGIPTIQFKMLRKQSLHSENLHIHAALFFKLRDVLAFFIIQIRSHIVIHSHSDS